MIGRRRGGALVLVLVLGTGALMLVATMLSLSRTGVLQEADQHRTRVLHAALQGAIARAVNEVNRQRAEGAAYVDPEGNGPGALGPADGSGLILAGPGGQPLCRYRAVVERASTRYGLPAKDVLVVAAAWPDFVSPARIVGAEVDLAREDLPISDNALSVIGEYDETKKFFAIDDHTGVSLTAPAADVAAVNVSDPGLHADFLARVVPDLALLEGADPANPGTLVAGAATVANSSPGVISQVTLDAIRAGIVQVVADSKGSSTSLGSNNVKKGATTDLPSGTYRVARKLELTGQTHIRGSGTLIVEQELILKEGSGIEWDGDIIVIEDDKAKLVVEGGCDLSLRAGVLSVVSTDASAKVQFKPGSEVTIGTEAEPAAFAALAGTTDDSIKFSNKDLDMTIHGILAVMASKRMEIHFDAGQVDIVGSLGMVMAEGTTKTELSVEMHHDADISIAFDRAAFDGAMGELGRFFDREQKVLPMRVTAYWEPSVVDVLALQGSIMSGAYGAWGMP